MPTAAPNIEPNRVSLDSDMTIYQAETLLATLRPHLGNGPLVVDLGAVAEIDSSGVQLLLMIQRHQRKTGNSLTVADAGEPVRRVLGQLGLTDWFEYTSAASRADDTYSDTQGDTP